jgi:hypothetical protein
MNIDINIYSQSNGRYRKLYLIIGILALIYLALSIAMPRLELQTYYAMWIVFVPGIIDSIVYGLGRNQRFADLFPYLRISETRIEKNGGGFLSKSAVYDWVNIKSIDIRLFELRLIDVNDQVILIDLSNLSDDNLALVKEFVSTIKRTRNIRS